VPFFLKQKIPAAVPGVLVSVISLDEQSAPRRVGRSNNADNNVT
jgi:hypothetical protein